jgi:signal transduction histidine kinase
VERERQRLGRDLHTGVGQLLTAIRLQIESIETQLPQAPPAVRQALERISTLTRDALEQVRALSNRLHPPEWQRLTIEEALRQLWELSGIPQRFDASLRIEALPLEPGLELKILTYRAAQEAFSNLAEHARATHVEASLETRGGRLVLTVLDNGAGFDAAGLFSAPASLASGIGLRSIREQAAGLGGRIDIRSGPAGTTLELSAPYFQVQCGIAE